jgi:hypothetical protein
MLYRVFLFRELQAMNGTAKGAGIVHAPTA